MNEYLAAFSEYLAAFSEYLAASMCTSASAIPVAMRVCPGREGHIGNCLQTETAYNAAGTMEEISISLLALIISLCFL